jgi:hypothetical protein
MKVTGDYDDAYSLPKAFFFLKAVWRCALKLDILLPFLQQAFPHKPTSIGLKQG